MSVPAVPSRTSEIQIVNRVSAESVPRSGQNTCESCNRSRRSWSRKFREVWKISSRGEGRPRSQRLRSVEVAGSPGTASPNRARSPVEYAPAWLGELASGSLGLCGADVTCGQQCRLGRIGWQWPSRLRSLSEGGKTDGSCCVTIADRHPVPIILLVWLLGRLH